MEGEQQKQEVKEESKQKQKYKNHILKQRWIADWELSMSQTGCLLECPTFLQLYPIGN